jgi:putative FmdB family regulatory protein
MPIYEYLCENGHRFEVLQRMSDDALTTCEVCGAPVQRVLHPVAVHFKGSGFYTTDYGRGKGAKAEAAKESSSSSSSGSSDNGASPSKTTETKSAPATKSDS